MQHMDIHKNEMELIFRVLDEDGEPAGESLVMEPEITVRKAFRLDMPLSMRSWVAELSV